MTTLIPVRDPDGAIIDLVAPSDARATDRPVARSTDQSPDRPTSDQPATDQRPAAAVLPGAPTAAPRRTWRDHAGTAAIVVISLLALAALAWSQPATPSAPAAPVPTIAPTLAPTIAPTAVPVLDRAIVAYAAPGGDVIGAIEPGRPYTLQARSPGWVQLAIDGSGLVWVRAGDIVIDPAALARLPLAPADRPPAATALPPAPVVAPAAPAALPAAACTEATAPHRVTRQVVDDRGIPIGSVSAWSCVSAAAAEAEADRQEAALRGGGE